MTKASAPPPQGHYVPAKRHGDLIFVSGMTPRQNGKLLYGGQVKSGAPLGQYKAAAELSTQNALHAARALLVAGEVLLDAVSLTVYVNAPPDYTEHSKLADFVSAVLSHEFSGQVPSRAAIGVSSLPGGAPLEVCLIAAVGPVTV